MVLSTVFFNSFMLSGVDGTLQSAMDVFKPSSSALVDLRELQRAVLCQLHAGLFRADCGPSLHSRPLSAVAGKRKFVASWRDGLDGQARTIVLVLGYCGLQLWLGCHHGRVEPGRGKDEGEEPERQA